MRWAVFVARIGESLPQTDDFVMIVRWIRRTSNLSDCRKRHLKALGALFLQVLKLCETAGWFKLATWRWIHEDKGECVKHKAMIYDA